MPWRSNRRQQRALFYFVTAHCLLHAGRSGPSPSTPGLREVLDFAELEGDPRIRGIELVSFEVKP